MRTCISLATEGYLAESELHPYRLLQYSFRTQKGAGPGASADSQSKDTNVSLTVRHSSHISNAFILPNSESPLDDL